jgi:hypothetical protein
MKINDALQAINPVLKIRTQFHAASKFWKRNLVKRTTKNNLEARPIVPIRMGYQGHSGIHQ